MSECIRINHLFFALIVQCFIAMYIILTHWLHNAHTHVRKKNTRTHMNGMRMGPTFSPRTYVQTFLWAVPCAISSATHISCTDLAATYVRCYKFLPAYYPVFPRAVWLWLNRYISRRNSKRTCCWNAPITCAWRISRQAKRSTRSGSRHVRVLWCSHAGSEQPTIAQDRHHQRTCTFGKQARV